MPYALATSAFISANPARMYMMFDYVPGGNLRGRIDSLAQAGLQCGESEVASNLLQIICALEFLQGHGIFVLDLNPRHILHDMKGMLKLSHIASGGRFGLVDREPLVGGESRRCEAIAYLAPELLEHRHWKDPRESGKIVIW